MDGSEGGDGSQGEKIPPVVDVEDEAMVGVAPAVDGNRDSPQSFHSSSEAPLEVDEDAGAVGVAGVGSLSSRPGQDSSTEDDLAGLLARLRMNPLLRARLEENLIEDGRALGSARAQGLFFRDLFSFWIIFFVLPRDKDVIF